MERAHVVDTQKPNKSFGTASLDVARSHAGVCPTPATDGCYEEARSRRVKGVLMSQRDLINIWPVVCAAIVLGAAISLIV